MNGSAIRSLLFVPGDNEKLMLKALSSDADAVIIDLEDAVAPDRKGVAADGVGDLLSHTERNGKTVFVRVNGFETGRTAQDAAAVLRGRPWGLVLPKCQDVEEIEKVSHFLDALEAREGVAAGTTRIMTVATETATAVLGLNRPSRAPNTRFWGMLWGGEDLSAELGAQANREPSGEYTFPYQYARATCLYSASAWGAVAVDAVYTDFRDLDGLKQETLKAYRDGFTAKAAIHPAQVEVINAVMTPTPERLDWATRVLDALRFDAVAKIDGRMVDLAHKRVATRIIARAEALALWDAAG